MQNKSGQNNRKQLNAVQNLLAKKSIQTPHNNQSHKTRAKYDCPPALSELIYAANLLPKKYHFDLLEAVDENLKKIEHLEPRLEPQIDFDENTNIDEVLERSRILLERSRAWQSLFESCYNHSANWVEFYIDLPIEVRRYLDSSEELDRFRKSDSYHYWEHNDGKAWDYLNDLHSGNEITDKEYEEIQMSGEVADFLVEKGYYGEHWSYSKMELEDDNFSRHRSNKDKFYNTELFPQSRAYVRLEATRDFIYALTDLAQKLNEKSQLIRLDFKDHLPEKFVKEIRATTIKVSKNGKIYFSISAWAEAIQGIDITRIRVCEVCEKVFWAKRKDAFACSLQHAKTRQMRLLRTNWKEKGTLYLKSRNKNKLKKEKKNGTL